MKLHHGPRVPRAPCSWLSWMWLQLITAGSADKVFGGGPTMLVTAVTAVTSQHDDDVVESLYHDLAPTRWRSVSSDRGGRTSVEIYSIWLFCEWF